MVILRSHLWANHGGWLFSSSVLCDFHGGIWYIYIYMIHIYIYDIYDIYIYMIYIYDVYIWYIYIYINLQRSYLLYLGYLIVHGETRNFSYLARKHILQCVAVYPRLVVRCHGWSSTVTRHLTSFILGYDLNHMPFIGGYIRWQRYHIRSQYPLDLNQYMLGQVVWNMVFILFHFIYGMSSETHWRSPSFFKMIKMISQPPTSIWHGG